MKYIDRIVLFEHLGKTHHFGSNVEIFNNKFGKFMHWKSQVNNLMNDIQRIILETFKLLKYQLSINVKLLKDKGASLYT